MISCNELSITIYCMVKRAKNFESFKESDFVWRKKISFYKAGQQAKLSS